jgi:hypothetical protein
MHIQAEFDAGETIDIACRDICTLATRIGFGVEADFSGVRLVAKPNGSPEKLRGEWHQALRSKSKVKIAFS